MTDRELLELAAKAAGYRYTEFLQLASPRRCGLIVPSAERGARSHLWNPLDDDRDALRLAVKLEIHSKWLEGKPWAWAVGKNAICCTEPFGNDPYAATRRAIVRAAAKIGGAMP